MLQALYELLPEIEEAGSNILQDILPEIEAGGAELFESELSVLKELFAEYDFLEELIAEELNVIEETIDWEGMIAGFSEVEANLLEKLSEGLAEESSFLASEIEMSLAELKLAEIEFLAEGDMEYFFKDLVNEDMIEFEELENIMENKIIPEEQIYGNESDILEYKPQHVGDFSLDNFEDLDYSPPPCSLNPSDPSKLKIRGYPGLPDETAAEMLEEITKGDTTGVTSTYIDEIEFDPKLGENPSLFGNFSRIQNKIRLDPTKDPEEIRLTFFHEKFHAIIRNHHRFTEAQVLDLYEEQFGNRLFLDSKQVLNEFYKYINRGDNRESLLHESMANAYEYLHKDPEMMMLKYPEKVKFLLGLLPEGATRPI